MVPWRMLTLEDRVAKGKTVSGLTEGQQITGMVKGSKPEDCLKRGLSGV